MLNLRNIYDRSKVVTFSIGENILKELDQMAITEELSSSQLLRICLVYSLTDDRVKKFIEENKKQIIPIRPGMKRKFKRLGRADFLDKKQ
jgi:hypothetical protein